MNSKVDVYRNLRTGNFSIRKKGKVIAYADSIILKDVLLIVSQKGRQRVLDRKQRNVHAYARGHIVEGYEMDKECLREAYYNPYKCESFIDKETNVALHDVKLVLLENQKIYYIN